MCTIPDQKEQSDAPITLAEYEALAETHAEVHEGKLFRLSGTTRTHSIVLGELFSTIHAQIQTLDCPCEVHTSTCDVLLSTDPLIVFQPDLMIVSNCVWETNMRYEGAPPIVMEIVSPATEYNDYTYKLAMYCKYGVKEYWIIDPGKENIVVCCFGEDLSPQVYSFRDLISSHVCPAIRVDFARIRQILSERGLIPRDSDPEDNKSSN